MRSDDEDDEEEYDEDQEDEDVVNGQNADVDEDDDDGDGDADGDVGMDGGGSDDDDDEDDEDDEGEGDDDEEGDEDEEDEDDEEGDEDDEEGDGDGDGDEEDEDVDVAEADEDGSARSPHPSKSPTPRNQPVPPHLLRRNLLTPAWTSPPSSLSIDVIVGIPLPAPVHALASTLCSSFLLAGSQEGYVRVYDFYASVNGGQMMTAQQKTMVGLGESVNKAGVGKGWWPVEVGSGDAKKMEPIYSMACESDGLWTLAGTQSGAINLYTLRHSPGHLVHTLKGHNNVVSTMAMLPGEKSFLSGSWDGTVREWDLNTGQTVRSYPTHGAQISTLALKPFAHPPSPSPSPENNIEVDGEAGGPPVSVNVGPDFFAADRANGNAEVGSGEQTPKPGEASGEAAAQANGSADPPAADVNGDADADADGEGEADAEGEREASYDPLFDDDADAEGEEVNMSDLPTAVATPSAAPSLSLPNGTGTGRPANGGGLALPGASAQAGPSRTAPTRVGAASTIPLLTPTMYSSFSDEIVLTASMDGQVTLLDRRMQQGNVGRLMPGEKAPPWCMSACWSGDGRQVFAGRRNGTVDIWDLRRSLSPSGASSSGAAPRLLKTLKTPTESGPVSCVVAMPDGRHLATASQDNIRLWNTLEYFDPDESMKKRGSRPPFKIIAGHHGGTISSMLVDHTSRFLTTASGDRGWQGESTKVVLIHEIKW